jgi:hypothetical protein
MFLIALVGAKVAQDQTDRGGGLTGPRIIAIPSKKPQPPTDHLGRESRRGSPGTCGHQTIERPRNRSRLHTRGIAAKPLALRDRRNRRPSGLDHRVPKRGDSVPGKTMVTRAVRWLLLPAHLIPFLHTSFHLGGRNSPP